MREVLNNRKLFSKEKEGSFPGLDEDIIAYVAAQILNAVVFLHKNNISHGAIRSDNILVSKKGHLKLTRYWHRKYYRKLGIVGHYLSDVQGLNGEWIEKVPPIKVTETPVEPQTTTPPVEPAATPNNIEELSSMIDVSVVQEDHPAEKKPTKEEDPPSIIRRRRKTATRRSTRVGANDGDESPVKSPTKAQQEENQKPKEKVDEEKEPDDYWGSPQDKKNTWTLKSDIWALGVTLIELTGTCPPYILQLDNQYSDSMREFIVACTTEDLDSRPTAEALLSYKFITDAPKCSPSLVAGYLSVDKSSEDPSDENKPEEINFTKGNEERIRKFIQSQIERFNQTVVKDLNEENDKLKALVNTLSAQVSKLQTDVTELRKRKNKPTKT
uniref:Protein kinase domain-containing protein n=1 Tax=Arcella intermedia TaxID=1963864 RepID=A0A6B2L5D3_9EUKA